MKINIQIVDPVIKGENLEVGHMYKMHSEDADMRGSLFLAHVSHLTRFNPITGALIVYCITTYKDTLFTEVHGEITIKF